MEYRFSRPAMGGFLFVQSIGKTRHSVQNAAHFFVQVYKSNKN